MKGLIPIPSGLEERVREAADLIGEVKHIRVVSHYDSDGISSAAVLAGMLKNASKPFQVTMTRSLDAHIIERLKSERNDLVLFSDMGSGQLDLIGGMNTKAVVLDHHRVTEDTDSIVHINPSMWGFNGTTDVSGATTSFLLAQYLDETNWALAPCALAGAYGDMQHLGGYRGINLLVMQKAVEKGQIEERLSLSLQGGSALEAIALSAEPYFRGYSGRKDLVADLCSQISVDPGKQFADYTEAEMRRLSSVLMLMLASSGCPYEYISQIVSVQHVVKSSGMTISELSSLANACGRSERYSVGLAMELGDGQATSEAKSLRSQYNGRVLERLIALEEGVEQMEHIQCFRSDDASLAGALCGLYMSFIGDKSKPTVAYSLSGDSYKISARGTKQLVEKGLDLASGLSGASGSVGGVGGGHVIASGATVPRDELRKFLGLLDDITGKQISG